MCNEKLKYPELEQICSMPLEEFKTMFPNCVSSSYDFTQEKTSKVKWKKQGELNSGDTYIYVNNNSKILGVCHLDYVDSLAYHYCETDLNEPVVFCPRLDDRLGVYGLLKVLPYLSNYPYDILLTTGEESGLSSAHLFEPAHEYNWMFELDRRGIDYVTYNMDTLKFRDAIKSCGWIKGWGSFSDIACLSSLHVCGANFGIGYQDEHTKTCCAFMNDFETSMKKVAMFINEFAEQKFELKHYNRSRIYNSPHYDDWYWGQNTCSSTHYKAKKAKKTKSKTLTSTELENDALCQTCLMPLNKEEMEIGVCEECVRYWASMGCYIADGEWRYTDELGDVSVLAQQYVCDLCQITFDRADLIEYKNRLYCADCLATMNLFNEN